jgi:hypothetical protein
MEMFYEKVIRKDQWYIVQTHGMSEYILGYVKSKEEIDRKDFMKKLSKVFGIDEEDFLSGWYFAEAISEEKRRADLRSLENRMNYVSSVLGNSNLEV